MRFALNLRTGIFHGFCLAGKKARNGYGSGFIAFQ